MDETSGTGRNLGFADEEDTGSLELSERFRADLLGIPRCAIRAEKWEIPVTNRMFSMTLILKPRKE
ncbi:hypothetical protein E6H34_10070 [Candidatus Bathyarchaeota archaeon]|nr:MAG: hypothetical protein E6H34_10070 [Candidatus Bathyarchaeota archaeon]